MDLHAIMNRIADGADDFLAGASNRSEARAGIAELVNADYHQLSPADKTEVIEGVMKILEEEDFFAGLNSATRSADDELTEDE